MVLEHPPAVPQFTPDTLSQVAPMAIHQATFLHMDPPLQAVRRETSRENASTAERRHTPPRAIPAADQGFPNPSHIHTCACDCGKEHNQPCGHPVGGYGGGTPMQSWPHSFGEKKIFSNEESFPQGSFQPNLQQSRKENFSAPGRAVVSQPLAPTTSEWLTPLLIILILCIYCQDKDMAC